MTLSNTITLMNSDDYKKRFVAEYFQTKIRYERLHRTLIKMEAGTIDVYPKCDINLLSTQAKHMRNYLNCLEIRAEIEGISLYETTCVDDVDSHFISEDDDAFNSECLKGA